MLKTRHAQNKTNSRQDMLKTHAQDICSIQDMLKTRHAQDKTCLRQDMLKTRHAQDKTCSRHMLKTRHAQDTFSAASAATTRANTFYVSSIVE